MCSDLKKILFIKWITSWMISSESANSSISINKLFLTIIAEPISNGPFKIYECQKFNIFKRKYLKKVLLVV